MKVSRLIEVLSSLDQDLQVIISHDEEGESSSELEDVTEGLWFPESFMGWVYKEDEFGEDVHEDSERREKVVVLWPSD